MSLSNALLIATSAWLISSSAGEAFGADPLAQTFIGDFTEAKLSVVDVAVRLSQSRIPVGVEIVNGPEGSSVDLALKGATVGDVLNAAVRADARYQWEESDGVINLLPKQGGDPVFDIVIHRLEATNQPAVGIIPLLLNTSEVKTYLDNRRVQASMLIAGSFQAPPARGTLLVSDETLRHALNQVLIKTRSVYWSAGRDERDGKKYLWFQAW
jgi:hypothetical protein